MTIKEIVEKAEAGKYCIEIPKELWGNIYEAVDILNAKGYRVSVDWDILWVR